MSKPPADRNAAALRAQIANMAARLMAEDGVADYGVAKRKAAEALRIPHAAKLPDNTEIEAALHAYHRLFQGETHTREVDELRRKAIEMMEIVQQFSPYLSGPVLDGTAGPQSEIDLQLFADSAKEVEIFLLNRRIEFAHRPPRTERAEAVLAVFDAGSTINLVVYPKALERMVTRTRDGRVRPRARLEAVRRLLEVSP